MGAVKAIIFDCDGTLIESEEMHYLAWKSTVEEQGSLLAKEYYMRHFVGIGDEEVADILYGRGDLPGKEELLKIKNNYFEGYQAQGILPIVESVHFAEALFREKEAYGFKLAVASAARKKEILYNLQSLGIVHYFDLIVSGHDDLSEYWDRRGTNKPRPYIYIKAAKLLAVQPSSCIAIEDSLAGVTAALTAGCITVAVAHAYTDSKALEAHIKIDSFSGWSVADFLRRASAFASSSPPLCCDGS